PEHPPSLDYVPGPEYSEYLAPSDDEEDPVEDLVDYPANGGDDDDDDDDEAYEEDDDEEEERLALTKFATPTPSPPLSPDYVVDSDPKKDEKDPKKDPAYYPADRGNNDDESSNDDDDDDDTKQRENKVAGNASNKRKWEGDHNGSSSQQQNKEHKAFRAYTVRLSNKEDHVGNLPWCNRIPVPKAKSRSVVSGKKAGVICYGCEGLGHYKNNCPIVKFQKRVDKYWKGKARGDSSATTSNINI
nr:hypothetical protein [Tanacetum cinerariifolium]